MEVVYAGEIKGYCESTWSFRGYRVTGTEQ